MHEQIINLGWAWHGYCNCSRPGKTYKKRQYKLKHFYKHNLFELFERNQRIARGIDEELIKTIQKYDQVAIY